jgi:GT2 family glycosyltransferase
MQNQYGPLVSIIILSYNEKESFEKCLQSIKLQNYKNIELIIVDNASNFQEKLYSIAQKKFDKIIFIKNKYNEGFGKALNKGISKSKGKYILFLNNDVELFEDTVQNLVKHLENNPSTTIAYPIELTTKESRKKNKNFYEGIVFELNGFRFYSRTKDSNYFEPNCACFISRKNNLLFDEDYYLFGEENQIGFKQLIRGRSNHLVKNAFFIHASKKSVEKLSQFNISRNVEKYSLINFFVNWEIKTLLILTPILIFDLVYSYLYLLLTLKLSYLLGKFIGTIDFILFLPKIIEKRTKIQSIRLISDKKILEIFTNSEYILSNKKNNSVRDKIFLIYKKIIRRIINLV